MTNHCKFSQQELNFWVKNEIIINNTKNFKIMSDVRKEVFFSKSGIQYIVNAHIYLSIFEI